MTDARTLRDALLAEPCIRRRFPDDVNGIPGTGNLQWLRQRLGRIIAAARADALTAFGHHADGCEYALTVCTCGFTEAMRTLFDHNGGAAPVATSEPGCRACGNPEGQTIELHRDPGATWFHPFQPAPAAPADE